VRRIGAIRRERKEQQSKKRSMPLRTEFLMSEARASSRRRRSIAPSRGERGKRNEDLLVLAARAEKEGGVTNLEVTELSTSEGGKKVAHKEVGEGGREGYLAFPISTIAREKRVLFPLGLLQSRRE